MYFKKIPVQSHLIILEILVISENNLVNLVSSPYLVEFHVDFQLNILYAAYVLRNKQTKWIRENFKKIMTFIKKGGGVGSEICPNQKFSINFDIGGARNLWTITSPSFLFNL